MRRLLPFAMLLVACAKPEVTPGPEAPAPPPKAVETDLTPESMAKAMDVPIYPGATAPDGLSAAPERRADGSTHYSLVLATKDPAGKVSDWYAKALSLPSMPGMGIVGKSKGGNDVIITSAAEAGRTLIRIKSIAYAKP